MSDLKAGYEGRIGRYGPSLAREFLSVCELEEGMRVLDVGAGTGALTQPLVAALGTEAVVAIDPDEDALELCRARVPGVEAVVGAAEELPFAADGFDAVLAQLVVALMDDAERGVREMRRVARPGGLVATCVWDFHEGMTVLRSFWDSAAAVSPEARKHDQARTRPYARRAELEQLFAEAGLDDVTSGALSASADYESFEDLWQPMLIPDGAPGQFLATLSEAERDRVASELAQRLGSPDGPFQLSARAWFARGRA